MKKSIIRYPAGSKSLEIYDWQLKALKALLPEGKATGGQLTAACMLLSMFDYHYTNRYANRKYLELVEKAMRSPKITISHFGNWMPYSVRYLLKEFEDVYSAQVVYPAIGLLEDIDFINTKDAPNDLKSQYGVNLTWVRLNVGVIQQWIDENFPRAEDEKPYITLERRQTSAGRRGKMPSELSLFEAVEVFNRDGGKSKLPVLEKAVTILCEYHKNVHRKADNYLYDHKRRSYVLKALKEGRTLAQGAQAIVGNTKSDWHQGKTDRNPKVYDDLKHIFDGAERFENHIGYAEAAGITEEMAYDDLKRVLNNEPSSFMKPDAKAAQKPSRLEREAKEIMAKTASVEIPKEYRDFARVVSPFIATGLDNATIFIRVFSDDNLIEQSAKITDAVMLRHALVKAVSAFGDVSADMEARLHGFAQELIQRKNGDNQ